MKRLLKSLALLIVSLSAHYALAGQAGPALPTHHYPTDSSFHLNYNFGLLNSATNFVAPLQTDVLNDGSKLKIMRQQFIPEYQPNRRLSFGGIFNFDSVSITNESGDSQKISGLSDQFFFTEFRFVDELGYSVGASGMIKVPAYSNIAPDELAASSHPSQHALLGDSQIDTTALLTTEWWPSHTLRLRLDMGYTFRTDGYSGDVPYMASIGFVTPKMDFDLRVRGNMTLNNFPELDSVEKPLKDAFANSDYALSTSPSLVVIEPKIELWVNTKYALVFNYAYALSGNRAPSFHQFSGGLIYRWTGTQRAKRKTFKETAITTDQDSGTFEAEEGSDIEEPKMQDPIFE